jgi:inner membrane protein
MWGLMVSSLYLMATLGVKSYVEDKLQHNLTQQGISTEKLLTVPVSFGSIHWYGVARTTKNLQIGQYSIMQNEPIVFERFPVNDSLLRDVDPLMADRLKWFAQGYYTVAEQDGIIRVYNMQCDMQGVRTYGDYKAPTAFYFSLTPNEADSKYELSSGMHMETEGDR